MLDRDQRILAFDFERDGFPEWLGLVDEKIEVAAVRILQVIERGAVTERNRELVVDEIRRVLGLPLKYETQ